MNGDPTVSAADSPSTWLSGSAPNASRSSSDCLPKAPKGDVQDDNSVDDDDDDGCWMMMINPW